jgi:hypothetical protein
MIGKNEGGSSPSIFRVFSGRMRQRPALRNRRTCAYGGALHAYDKNRRHPIPAIFTLGQYCAVK